MGLEPGEGVSHENDRDLFPTDEVTMSGAFGGEALGVTVTDAEGTPSPAVVTAVTVKESAAPFGSPGIEATNWFGKTIVDATALLGDEAVTR